MKKAAVLAVGSMLVLLSVPAISQHHQSNWILRTATDTTIVPCWNDSLTWMAFPPNSMNMMMMPSAMYMSIDLMRMDSLRISYDSTFIGWCRVRAGSDSMHFDMMNGDSMNGSRNMMQFMKNLRCQFHWDSLTSDSAHRHWHLKGVKGWNGTAWANVSGTVSGNIVSFSTGETYSAIAFIGTASAPTSIADRRVVPGEFRLEQNFPNPFNPATTIRFDLPQAEFVSLKVFNLLGQEVATVVNGPRPAGSYSVRWDAGMVPSGAYFFQLSAGGHVEAKKLLLIR